MTMTTTTGRQTRRARRNWRNLIVASATLVTIATGAALVTFAFNSNTNPTKAAAADNSDEGYTTVAFDPEKDAIAAEAKCETNTFVDHSIRSVKADNPDKRHDSSSVSIPFKGTDDATVTKEILNEVCGNPTYLDMIVKEMLRWDIPGAQENSSWLKNIEADFKSNSLNFFVNKKVDSKNVTKEMFVTEQFQTYASWINTVLLRFNEDGRQEPISIRNWEQDGTWDPTKGLPVVREAGKQESKPAWVRSMNNKTGDCLIKLGFNAEDRRIELINCVEPAPEPEPEPQPQPQPQPGGEVPVTPVTPVTPWTPPSTHVEPKQPWKDPYVQGNAPIGGGQNANPGPGAVTTNPVLPPATPYVPPAPPVTQPPASTPDPTPAPKPEAGAPTEQKPETACIPNAFVTC